ncbi:unnamed protein product, partial [Rotaria magnacalcarata]
QNHNATVNGYYAGNTQVTPNHSKRLTKLNADPNTLLTTATIPNQSVELKAKTIVAQENEEEEDGD